MQQSDPKCNLTGQAVQRVINILSQQVFPGLTSRYPAESLLARDGVSGPGCFVSFSMLFTAMYLVLYSTLAQNVSVLEQHHEPHSKDSQSAMLQ